MKLNNLVLDMATRDVTKMCANLERLKTTYSLENGGMYREDRAITKLLITTTWDEEQLDEWLYRVCHGCEYFGTAEQDKPKVSIFDELESSPEVRAAANKLVMESITK